MNALHWEERYSTSVNHKAQEVAKHRNWSGASCTNFNAVCGEVAERQKLNLSRKDFVHVTPDPTFSRLNGANQGVRAGMEMFGGVLVLRGIATTHVAADEAKPQVDPSVSQLHALFADMSVSVLDLNLVQMSAVFSHVFHLSLVLVPRGPIPQDRRRPHTCVAQIPGFLYAAIWLDAPRHTSREIRAFGRGSHPMTR